MEADWEVEIGAAAPVIDAAWEGSLNLRLSPQLVDSIPEARAFPALKRCLVQLNSCGGEGTAPGSVAMRTTKCDVWDHGPVDPDEMEASPAQCTSAIACYIDLLPAGDQLFSGVSSAEAWVRSVVARLRARACVCCRVDMVIREAVGAGLTGVGVTAYLTACGESREAAIEAFGRALEGFNEALCDG